MSLVDTDQIWRALGNFYDLFPDDERVYWSTFWEAYSDIVADLWGLAFQVDRAKSLFDTTATFERREVLLKVSNLDQGTEATFRVSSLREQGGAWVLRGFVPRELRSFKDSDLSDRGLIRIGVDLLPYSQVNATTVVGGVYDGFVREAAFTLVDEPPHDYGDDPDFNDDFSTQTVELNLRVAHVAGGTIVDAVGSGTVNPSGVIQMGTSGVNAEAVEYESVTIVGNRYVFQLAQTWSAPDTGAEELGFDHANAEAITVYRHDVDRWSQRTTGNGRVVSRGSAELIVDDELTPVASTSSLIGLYSLTDNEDFDVSTTVSLDTWTAPTIVGTSKRVYARLNIGPLAYVVGIESRMTASGLEHVALSGIESSPTELALTNPPDRIELRFKKVSSALEFQLRDTDDQVYTVLSTTTVSGLRATMDLVLGDPDTQTPSRVAFDEVLRRAGQVVGNTRLEEFFTATATYPNVYDIDQRVTRADELRDRPRVRTEELKTVDELTDTLTTVVRGQGADDEFEAMGVPEAGILVIGGHQVVYDRITRLETGVIEFNLRRKLDPDIFPLARDTSFSVSTRVMYEDDDYRLPGDGTIELKELPTRDRFWAPVAQVDVRHVQNHFGVLTDLDADISTQTYLGRVQGTWFALMNGPSFRNVHSGLQLAMGLPVARIAGSVKTIRDYRDDLGRLIRRELIVLGERGEIVHELDASLYPHIDWSVNVGEIVEQFQPLTNGVEVWDVIADPVWHNRFPGIADIERFNTFGIFVAIEALSSEASVEDAVRFALRIKPTYTKLAMRFLLTSGNEDMSQELDDDVTAVLFPRQCEDMTLPEGDPPEDVLQILTLGAGHKLGQGKTLGGTGQWHAQTLGAYRRQGPFTGSLTAGSEIFEADEAGFSFVDAERTTGATAQDSSVFSDAGAAIFTSSDLGKDLVVLDGNDVGVYEILEILSSISVRVSGAFSTTDSGLHWRLRSTGFVADTEDADETGDGSIATGSSVFTTAGAYTFTAADVGKRLTISDATAAVDREERRVVAFLTATTVALDRDFEGTEGSLAWRLYTYGDVGKDIHVISSTDPLDTGDFKIIDVIDRTSVLVLRGSGGWVTTEDVDWELRDYETLDDGLVLGAYTAYRCPVPADHEPVETVDSEQIVTVAVGP